MDHVKKGLVASFGKLEIVLAAFIQGTKEILDPGKVQVIQVFLGGLDLAEVTGFTNRVTMQ